MEDASNIAAHSIGREGHPARERGVRLKRPRVSASTHAQTGQEPDKDCVLAHETSLCAVNRPRLLEALEQMRCRRTVSVSFHAVRHLLVSRRLAWRKRFQHPRNQVLYGGHLQ